MKYILYLTVSHGPDNSAIIGYHGVPESTAALRELNRLGLTILGEGLTQAQCESKIIQHCLAHQALGLVN